MTDASNALIKLAELRVRANETRFELEKSSWLLHPDSPYRRDTFEVREAEEGRIESLRALAATLAEIREAETQIGADDLEKLDPVFCAELERATAPNT